MKKLLIVVDYQNDFVVGTLGFPKAVELEQNITSKITKYRNNGDDIVFTFDTHTDDYLHTQEGMNLPIEHCIQASDGWNLYGSIAFFKEQQDVCFSKETFGSSELFFHLNGKDYKSIELVGVVSNICVISNAILAKTALPQVPVMVDASCVASNDDALNDAALDVMASLQIKISNR